MVNTIEDEKIYDLAEIKFEYNGQATRLVSSDGVTVTYKVDTDDIKDTATYYRVGTTIKKIEINAEIKGIVNPSKVRELAAKSITDKSANVSIGVYNKAPGQTPVPEDILYDVVIEEIKVEKKEGNSCDIKCSAGWSKIFDSEAIKTKGT